MQQPCIQRAVPVTIRLLIWSGKAWPGSNTQLLEREPMLSARPCEGSAPGRKRRLTTLLVRKLSRIPSVAPGLLSVPGHGNVMVARSNPETPYHGPGGLRRDLPPL
ncbi:unnamed protein product [Lota lota]